MKINTKLISVTLGALISLSGCGGGSDTGLSSGNSSTITGKFIDSEVQGLEYNCTSGMSGITNIKGEFTCKVGDTISFSINGFIIGSVIAQTTITPRTLYSDEIAIINLAQLLQTLDSDDNPDNGITIDINSQEVQGLNKSINMSFTQVDFDSLMVSYIGKSLVDEDTAKTHLEKTLLDLEKNTNTNTISSSASVIILTGVTQAVCSAQDYNENEFTGYLNYDDFKSKGGTAIWSYFNGNKSCSEYLGAGTCQVQDLSSQIGGTDSCTSVVTFPNSNTNIPTTEPLPTEITLSQYKTKYKRLMQNLTSSYIFFDGGDSYDIKPIYAETPAQDKIAENLYRIGGDINYGWMTIHTTKYSFTDSNLTQIQISADGSEWNKQNEIISSENNIYTKTTYNSVDTIKFTLPILNETLHEMYLDIGLDITFDVDDKAQYMYELQKFDSFDGYSIYLVMNESAYLKVKNYFNENYSIN